MEEFLIQYAEISFVDISAYFGLAAAGVMTVNLFLGLLLAMQYSTVTKWPRRRIPLSNIHKWTGYGALFLVFLHPLWLPLTRVVDYSVAAIFFPFISPEQPILISLGSLAAYALVFVVITAFLRQRFQYVFWKKLHYASYLVLVSFLIHGVFTEPSLKQDAEIDYLDGGKVFMEMCGLLSVGLIMWRVTYGRKMRAAISFQSYSAAAWSGELEVKEIISESDNVKVFRLVKPGGGRLPFDYLPGQFLNLRIIDGERVFTRSYSLSSAPDQRDWCEIAVRRIDGGKGSTCLHESIKVGGQVACAGPFGAFTLSGKEIGNVVLIAGGIGITPLMSMLRNLAHQDWPGKVYLLFSISTPDDTLFKKEIEAISQRYQQLKYLFLPSHADPRSWNGPIGRVNQKHLTEFIPQIERSHIFLCGPEAMMESVTRSLCELGVPDAQIRTESFGNNMVIDDGALSDATVVFVKSGKTHVVPKGRTLLNAAEECGIAMESLCRTGTCGACKVKLISGDVKMRRDDALTSSDLRQHLILACQSRATSAQIQIER